ncbi:MAG TPA: NADH-quinone oxidoreductase subunit L [Candidatus Acidoferrum sp.]|nr:NADH-quinone oxidoreductase subunit L [Candidatus Acidoferrum sp.]
MNTIVPWLVWVLPIVGSLLVVPFSRINRKVGDGTAALFPLLAAILATTMIPDVLRGETHDLQVQWIPSLGLKAGVLVDPLSVLMSNVVAWVSFLIVVYSIGYMRSETSLTRYWFFINYFIGNMLLLVLSDNLLQLMFGWEGVGLCSYALVGYWYTDEPDKWVGSEGQKAWGVPMAYSPSHAGLKAFVMTRIGDIGLLIAIFIIYSTAGTMNLAELSNNISWAGDLARTGLLLPTALLMLWGPIGKSAQMPLHEWLPDAMAGPTGVSALIHAATMVKAGVYLVARMGPIFYNAIVTYGQPFTFFEVVGWIGAITALAAAAQAIVAKELKKTLAYSTASQIGYMMLAIGVGGMGLQFATGYAAGLFHLMNHAIFKAAAFMAAGAIIHSCETRFMNEMGGIRSNMKLTFAAMLVSVLALSGVPPFSGFWSKDAILTTAWEAGQFWLFLIAAVTAMLTFIYSLKIIGSVFLGPKSAHIKELEQKGSIINEASPLVYIPYVLLAAATIGIGVAGPVVEEALSQFLIRGLHLTGAASSGAGAASLEHISPEVAVAFTTIVVLLSGGAIGYALYISRRIDISKVLQNHLLRSVYEFLWNRLYVNPAYYIGFVQGTLALSGSLSHWVEIGFFDRINGAVSQLSVGLSKTGDRFDFGIVDGAVNGVAATGKRFSGIVAKLQTGIAQQYLLVFAFGVFLIMLALTFLGK